mmetsp:Transcript_80480/g.260132  ORF Transcript_80480/g.260132 Transcript_80480/m.260132 type:complete len:303 (+) Transcript_80480:344-1252(+)
MHDPHTTARTEHNDHKQMTASRIACFIGEFRWGAQHYPPRGGYASGQRSPDAYPSSVNATSSCCGKRRPTARGRKVQGDLGWTVRVHVEPKTTAYVLDGAVGVPAELALAARALAVALQLRAAPRSQRPVQRDELLEGRQPLMLEGERRGPMETSLGAHAGGVADEERDWLVGHDAGGRRVHIDDTQVSLCILLEQEDAPHMAETRDLAWHRLHLLQRVLARLHQGAAKPDELDICLIHLIGRCPRSGLVNPRIARSQAVSVTHVSAHRCEQRHSACREAGDQCGSRRRQRKLHGHPPKLAR